MPVQFTGSVFGHGYYRTTTPLLNTTTATLTGWTCPNALPTTGEAYTDVFSFGSTGPGQINGPSVSLFNNATSTVFNVGFTSTDVRGTTVPVIGTWYYVALVVKGTTGRELWVNGVREVNDTTNTEMNNNVQIGQYGSLNDNTSATTPGLMRVGNVRLWNAALSQSEIIREWQSAEPVRKQDLRAWWKLQHFLDLYDYSGRGQILTRGASNNQATADSGRSVAALPSLVRRYSDAMLFLNANSSSRPTRSFSNSVMLF